MSFSLDGCWAKIERAKENIKKLASEIDALNNSDPPPYRIVGKLEPEKKAFSFTAFGEPPPLRFSVLAGEVVHQLRSSLDHLVWAMVLQRHKSPSFRVQFPICVASQRFKEAKNNGILKGLSIKAVSMIESMQPYHRLLPENDTLAILHAMSVQDKHTLLLVVTAPVILEHTIKIDGGGEGTEVVGMAPPPELSGLQASKDGTEIWRVEFGRFHADTKVYADFSFQISFQKFGSQKNQAIISSLISLADRVEEVIHSFE